MKLDDQVTDLCADIDAWRSRPLAMWNQDPRTGRLLRDADELLLRSRELLKELLADGPH